MKKIIAASLMVLSMSASAEMVEYDWKVEGDGDVTLDAQTGKLWLDLDVTKMMSINDVKAELANGTSLSGWRLPTYEEMQELAGNIYGMIQASPNAGFNNTYADDSEKAEHYLFGRPQEPYTYGLYELNGGSYLFGSSMDDRFDNGVYFNYQFSADLNHERVYEGVYLVSDDQSVSMDANIMSAGGSTDVSAPTAFGGLLASLFFFSRLRGRNKK